MPLRLVAYDVEHSDKQFAPLEEAIRKYPMFQQLQSSVWMIYCSKDVGVIRDELADLVPNISNLMVCEIADWAGAGRSFSSGAATRRSLAA